MSLEIIFSISSYINYSLSMFVHFPIVSRFSDDRYVNPNNFLDTDKHTDIYFDHFLPVYTVCEAIFFFGTYPAEFALLSLHHPISNLILILSKILSMLNRMHFKMAILFQGKSVNCKLISEWRRIRPKSKKKIG